jgi:nucleoside-diphosphate-sugar epimerase
MSRKILLTGLSSFTGAHIARAFIENGDEVWASLTQTKNSYNDDYVKRRIEFSGVKNFIENAPLGSDNFLKSIQEKKFNIFINHGASIKGYRSPDFDFRNSFSNSTLKLREIIIALKESGCERVIHSGSMFEPGEGYSQAPGAPTTESPAVSIYGVTKNLIWQVLKFFAQEQKLPCSKIVIPNPIGTWENLDRLAPFFAKEWKSGRVPTLNSAKFIRDNIPAPWLARFYLEEALNEEAYSIRRPRGFVISNKELVEKLANAFSKVLGTECRFNIEDKASSEPLIRKNTEMAPESQDSTEVEGFWREWASFLHSSI